MRGVGLAARSFAGADWVASPDEVDAVFTVRISNRPGRKLQGLFSGKGAKGAAHTITAGVKARNRPKAASSHRPYDARAIRPE
jgi:hypothetical protein